MKVIVVHNTYPQQGGEETVVHNEIAMLKKHGINAVPWIIPTTESGIRDLIICALAAVWNPATYTRFRKCLKKEKPDIVHCHNTFPLISPAIYWACKKEKIPVVQTLHNYRLVCPNAVLFRTQSCSSEICELCLQKSFKWPGILYGCYRGSKAASAVVALMLWVHRLLGTWQKKVDAYIVMTDFQKHKMVAGGLPSDRIHVKPNFVNSTEKNAEQNASKKPYGLYVGRLSPEKGCDLLINAWDQFCKKADNPESPILLIAGDGPDRTILEEQVAQLASGTIEFLGQRSKPEVLYLMQNAQFLVSPSVCYETFGLVVLEASLQGTPSIISQPSAAASLASDRNTGLLFKTGDTEDLAEKIGWAFSNPEKMTKIGNQAQQVFKTLYSEKENFLQLEKVYKGLSPDIRIQSSQ